MRLLAPKNKQNRQSPPCTCDSQTHHYTTLHYTTLSQFSKDKQVKKRKCKKQNNSTARKQIWNHCLYFVHHYTQTKTLKFTPFLLNKIKISPNPHPHFSPLPLTNPTLINSVICRLQLRLSHHYHLSLSSIFFHIQI
jgi:hypothetical protein